MARLEQFLDTDFLNSTVDRRSLLRLLTLLALSGAAGCSPPPDNSPVPIEISPPDNDPVRIVIKDSLEGILTPEELNMAVLVLDGKNERGNIISVEQASGAPIVLVKDIPHVDLPLKNVDPRIYSPEYALPRWTVPTFKPFSNLVYGASLSRDQYGPLAYDHDPRFILGLAAVESGGKTDAVSRSGARGWTQFMPGTWTSHMNVLRRNANQDARFRQFLINMTGEDILAIQGEPNPFHPGWGTVASNEYVRGLLPEGPIPPGSIADPRTGRYTEPLESYVRAAQNAAYKYWKGKGAPDGDRTSVYERYIGDWVGAIGTVTRPKLLDELIRTRVYDRDGGVNTVVTSINKWAQLYGFTPLEAAKLLQDLKSV